MKSLHTFLIFLLVAGCSQRESYISARKEQIITVEANGRPFQVWTQRIGSHPTHRLLLLHGGPGMTHDYFESFEKHFPQAEIEFIYYDQLGSGKSDNPDDTTFWNIPRFVEEVEQVRQVLGLDRTNFFLLGHSWGGILAIEYALKYQQNLRGLIISNMMASCIDYGQYAEDVLAPQFDAGVLARVRALEAAQDYDNPEYMELLMEHYYPRHVLRQPVSEWPDPVNRALEGANQRLYVYMQGPSEFGIGGTLARWDRKSDLPKIVVPTLTIGAAHDTMDPSHMKWMAAQVKNGTYLHCPEGGHMAMWDDGDVYHNGIINFMKSIK